MANKRFPTDTPLKATPDTADFLLLADSVDGQVSKRATLQSVIDQVESGLNLSNKADKVNVLELDNLTSYIPTSLYHPTTKNYVDTLMTAKADKVNVLELNNTTYYLPTTDYHPTTKSYVDTEITSLSAAISGDTTSADLELHEADVSNPHEVTLTQAMAVSGGQGAVVSDVELQDYSETLVTTPSVAGTLTLDYSTSNAFKTTLHENVTSIVISNPPASGKVGSFTLQITQDAATPRTVSWGSILWNAGTPPTMTAALGGIDFYTFTTFDAGSTWYGFAIGQAMA